MNAVVGISDRSMVIIRGVDVSDRNVTGGICEGDGNSSPVSLNTLFNNEASLNECSSSVGGAASVLLGKTAGCTNADTIKSVARVAQANALDCAIL